METNKTENSNEFADDEIRQLGRLCTRDNAGRHFTEWFDVELLDRLERAGYVTVDRPVHEATGIPYSQEYYSVEVTDDGEAIYESYGCG